VEAGEAKRHLAGATVMRAQEQLFTSFLKFNYVGPVINPHGTELAQEILAEQSVEFHVEHLLQLVQIHDGNLLRGPNILG
jgi:hypothetical protein